MKPKKIFIQGLISQYGDLSDQMINFQKSRITFSPKVFHVNRLYLPRTMNIPFVGRLGKPLGR